MLHDGAWAGQTAIIIGGGPSVGLHDVTKLQGRGRIIAINRALELPIKPDIWTWLDDRLWMWAIEGKLPALYEAILNYDGLKITRLVSREKKSIILPSHIRDRLTSMIGNKTLVDNMYPDDVIFIPFHTEYKLGESLATKINIANNTGFWAINIAFCLGVDQMLLLGFDCDHEGKHPDTDSVAWWHDGYPEFINAASTKTYAKYFSDVASQLSDFGITVVNASPLTQLKCWPVADTLETAFEMLGI